ncbi:MULTISPECIES: 16S rRNA (adenine(1518)-N(6)/adenine(1519)-N(6))-dimethyltransferase RsmA [Legionella]|uniref:Ribosomal RNA small subunit methyltransferase A n=1 Tax=Legionella septentrionalis TaxID=2498109 RepID=A0A433JIH3_9GAMM|nr:16S rRNA (adenine(1518)-N(6)/adenine(1519)-N(6))-dimethyltransferase RsmA [Legionella septentrionalis]RUQ85050.1 16S rRNA (adenine(1518)-N(6)/adenine(1519)-N(6))-dimethyltransferase RsmA [Legionella septentrionalis]RUQ95660.1 16S rRNA (adenine(1518)-N(6)/adenine(1519)-N(6))-dimethyltransferase RsmA [Legionella septentrionalis]RUR09580.1 16S rRNA (adenine(1518)-N(6)/adenine(1519)-N(6))-dimethyltransferase RsmA [Legionella septentrionalis]RUR13881.1 16S rRNA (adenine(1518)-N(6)/adenine(1519)-N
MGHRPRKRFGQNFLQNQHVIAAILQNFHAQQEDKVLEIGPGLGALTKPLLKILNHLIAIEIDADLQAMWASSPIAAEKLQLIAEDALTVDYSQFGRNLRIIGNLPYNISTPLLIRLLQFIPCIEDMHFMLQKEVVERLAASPHCKDYGRLSVIVQYYCEVEHLFDVPADAFYPQPKVESAVVRLLPYKISPYPQVSFTVLERLLAQAFGMRRKTLANNLKPICSAATLSHYGIDPSLRPEQIPVADYARLAHCLNAAE